MSSLAVAGSARGQSSAAPAAEQLFREGHSLIAAGRVSEACQKFGESQRLDPAIGTLLNLAICHERVGRLASAWAEYVDVAALAARAGQRDREAFAREKTLELEPRLSRLTITVQATSSKDVVNLDGVRLGPATLATAIPVDSGPHHVEVLRGDGRRWERDVVVEPDAKLVRVEVPAAFETPSAQTPEPGTTLPSGSPVLRSPSPRRWIAVGVGTVGVVAAGFATVYAVTSASRARGGDSSRARGDEATALQFDDQATLLRNYAVVSGTFAAAAVGAGLYLWFTTPSTADPSKRSVELVPSVGLKRGSIELRVRF